jgi:hypothetical protein
LEIREIEVGPAVSWNLQSCYIHNWITEVHSQMKLRVHFENLETEVSHEFETEQCLEKPQPIAQLLRKYPVGYRCDAPAFSSRIFLPQMSVAALTPDNA